MTFFVFTVKLFHVFSYFVYTIFVGFLTQFTQSHVVNGTIFRLLAYFLGYGITWIVSIEDGFIEDGFLLTYIWRSTGPPSFH